MTSDRGSSEPERRSTPDSPTEKPSASDSGPSDGSASPDDRLGSSTDTPSDPVAVPSVGMIGMLQQVALPIALPLRHLTRVDFRNARMATRTLGVLGRPRLRNWWYNRGFLRELPKGAYRALLDPNSMNDFQAVRAEDGYVSTPADGLLAGVTNRGRVSTLFAPHTGFTDQIPYYVDDRKDLLRGAKPRDGAFFGIRWGGSETGTAVEWLWESVYDHDLHPIEGTGMLELETTRRQNQGLAASDRATQGRLHRAADRTEDIARRATKRRQREDARQEPVDLRITETIYVVPETDVLARDIHIRNCGEEPIESVVYYTQANANAELQYPPGITSPNTVTAETGELRWSDTASDRVVRVVPEPGIDVRDAGVADASLGQLFTEATMTAEGHYVGGYLDLDVQVRPGESDTVTVYTTGRSDVDLFEQSALVEDVTTRQAAAREWWADVVNRIDVEGVPKRHVSQFVTSTIALANLYDPDSGSISAAPHVQPAYYPSWPRDGGIAAVALARAGLPEIAADFLGRFLPGVQEDDGSFAQCYASNGERAGVIPVENDQQPVFAWAVAETYTALKSTNGDSGDDSVPEAASEFLDRAWPAVSAALDYTVGALAANDLLEATHDYAEMWTDADQSLWMNTFAYRGLLDGVALAREVGEIERADVYGATADRIGDAIEAAFFGVDATAGRLSSGAEPEASWSPVGRFASHLTITGPEQRPTTMNAVALWPTGWADDYGYRGEILPSLAAAYAASPTRWLPKEFAYAAALYRVGDADATDTADGILADLAGAVTDGGTFAEEVEADGTQNFAALGWSNAGFVLALDERRRASE